MNDTTTTDNSSSRAPVPGSEAGPRRNPSTMYLVLFSVALFGFTALSTYQAVMSRRAPEARPLVTEEELAELHIGVPWLTAAQLASLCAGAALLIIYIGLRIGRIRSVRQEPQNALTWTLGAFVKGLVIVFFLLVLINITGFMAFSGTVMPGMAAGVIIGAAVDILAVVCVLFMLREEYGTKLADIGLKLKAPLANLGYGFLTYLAIMPVFSVVILAWRWLGGQLGLEYQLQPVVACLLKSDSMLTVVLITVSAVIVAPIVEEFMFRCFTYPVLRKRLGVSGAILITSAFFALIHLNFFAFPPIFVLGVALAFLYERRQNIVAPAALHFLHNAHAIGLILLLRFSAS